MNHLLGPIPRIVLLTLKRMRDGGNVGTLAWNALLSPYVIYPGGDNVAIMAELQAQWSAGESYDPGVYPRIIHPTAHQWDGDGDGTCLKCGQHRLTRAEWAALRLPYGHGGHCGSRCCQAGAYYYSETQYMCRACGLVWQKLYRDAWVTSAVSFQTKPEQIEAIQISRLLHYLQYEPDRVPTWLDEAWLRTIRYYVMPDPVAATCIATSIDWVVLMPYGEIKIFKATDFANEFQISEPLK